MDLPPAAKRAAEPSGSGEHIVPSHSCILVMPMLMFATLADFSLVEHESSAPLGGALPRFTGVERAVGAAARTARIGLK